MDPNRRSFVLTGTMMGLSAASCASGVPMAALAATDANAVEGSGLYTFLSPSEARFVEAAADTLIPPGGDGPGGVEAGVPTFIDRALAGAYGTADGTYQDGPFRQGQRTQGYQLPAEPSAFYRVAIRDVDRSCQDGFGSDFADLSADRKADVFKGLESGDRQLATIPGQLFFGVHWFDVQCGYFSDPIHGGNKGMEAWKMVGFPGANPDLRKYVGAREYITPTPISLLDIEGGRG